MSISNQRKQEIIAAFQRSLKHDNCQEIEAIGLQELKRADEILGNRDSNAKFRLAMKNRLKDL